jgi:UPF0042 nucleotide-binding protein
LSKNKNFPIIIITGLSGAGKSTVLKVFEDLGFFSIDGLPVRLVPSLIDLFVRENPKDYRGLALGMDLRQQDFIQEWTAIKDSLQKDCPAWQTRMLIFLEASIPVLVRRYAMTRRPHPLAGRNLGLEDALKKEKNILEPLRQDADLVIDTSSYSIHDLRRVIQEKWECLGQSCSGMRVHLISFGFKYGVPLEADMVFDLRFLPNPYFQPELRPLSGQDQIVADFVLGSDPAPFFMEQFKSFLGVIVPLYAQEGRYRLTLAMGCTGGRHRSVAVTEAIYKFLEEKGFMVSIEHRHLQLG